MKPQSQYVSLPGSERNLPPGARYLGPSDSEEQIQVSVYLRSRLPVDSTLHAQQQGKMKRLTRKELSQLHGAHPDDVAQIETFARQQGLQVVSKDPARRLITLSGSAAAMSRAFGVELGKYEHRGRTYRGRVGPIHVPAHLVAVVESVLGLDNRPQAQPRFHLLPRDTPNAVSYTVPQVAQLYDFPSYGKGAGQCIGLIELGGGFVQADLDAFFASLQITGPSVSAFSVDGATNSPTGDPNGPDGEVMLDIEVAGAVAPGANIVVYFAPNSDQGFIDAVATAIFDNVNKPSVISISWGGPEDSWSSQTMQTMDQLFRSAAVIGITTCIASGDSGSSDGEGDGLAHADFPASSPFALACGGTSLQASQGAISSETVWNDDKGASGGGVSDVFDLPSWQVGANVPPSANPGGRVGRGVPDVAANADPYTGYQTRVDGQNYASGGTSAAAPLWAGLFALINEQLTEPVGYVNPLLYQDLIDQADVTRDIVTGNNGAYQAGPGWDACTGFGAPNGEDWLAALIY